MTGAILPPIVAAAAASAKTEGSPHAFLLFRLLDKPEPHVEASLARGGLVLWVLLSDNALEVTPALHQAGGEFLRVQYIPFDRALSAR